MPIESGGTTLYWATSDNNAITQWYNITLTAGSCSSSGTYVAFAPQSDGEYDETAKNKAMSLLKSVLDDQQIKDLESNSYFFLVGSAGNRYKINASYMIGNVEEIDDDGMVAKYCAHPMNVPIGDVILAQKVWLETDEEGFKRVANCHWRRNDSISYVNVRQTMEPISSPCGV